MRLFFKQEHRTSIISFFSEPYWFKVKDFGINEDNLMLLVNSEEACIIGPEANLKSLYITLNTLGMHCDTDGRPVFLHGGIPQDHLLNVPDGVEYDEAYRIEQNMDIK